jgi:cell division protein FtsX
MFNHSFSKVFKQDLNSLLKTSWTKIFWVSIFIGFLLFLLNIFLWISLYANQFTGQLKDRLGMYFYIKEDTTQTNEIYKKIITLKDELETQWLKVMFSSKDDALAFLQKKIPDVVSNFQKFGIDNPLPATLYVMFDSDSKYESLKTIILKNKDIIINTKDIDAWSTLQQQENRVLTIINLSNFIVWFAYVIIAILLLMILSFLWFLLKNIFHTFHKELEIKKTLWASYAQVTHWFIALTLNVLWFSFLICLALLLISWITINLYISALFNITLWSIFNNIILVLSVFIAEIIIVSWVGFGFSYFFARALNKKL